jgi:hypothetical protein
MVLDKLRQGVGGKKRSISADDQNIAGKVTKMRLCGAYGIACAPLVVLSGELDAGSSTMALDLFCLVPYNNNEPVWVQTLGSVNNVGQKRLTG